MSIPVAVFIWIMIYPMMLKVDFQSVKHVARHPQGIVVTCVVNWLIKPFTMFAIAWLSLFVVFKAWVPQTMAREYLAGAVLLGAAPCTAMVFVWSYLSKGNVAYTLVQVAVNDLLFWWSLFLSWHALGCGWHYLPYAPLLLCVVLFVVLPLIGDILTRKWVVCSKGQSQVDTIFVHKFDSLVTMGLLLTQVILFPFQGKTNLPPRCCVAGKKLIASS